MAKKNLPALPSARKSKKITPVTYTEEETNLHTQKERELEKLKADQSELTGITQQLKQYKSDPLIMLTQRETVSALEQRAAEITGRYGSQSALDTAVSELSRQVNDPKLKYLNSPDYRSRYQRLLDLGSGGQSVQNNFKEMGLEYLTPEERGRYNYYYYKHGKNKADDYLTSIQGDLNTRRAAEIVEDTTIAESSLLSNILKLKQGYDSGLDTWQQNMRHSSNIFSGDDSYAAPTAQQMASARIRQQMADQGMASQIAYDVAESIGYQSPAILASTVLGSAGKGLIGVEAIKSGKALVKAGELLGNAMLSTANEGDVYQDAINQGFSSDQARNNAIITGTINTIKNYLFSGISKIGGKLSNHAAQMLADKIDNVAGRVVATFGAKAIFEWGGDYLQNIVNQTLNNALLGVDQDVERINEDALYDSIVDTITAGIFEGPSIIKNEYNMYQQGIKLKNAGITGAQLAEVGNSFSPNTRAYRLSEKVNERTSASTMGSLLNELGTSISEQNIRDITKSLINRGMSGKIAKKNAEILAYVFEGGKISATQMKMMEKNSIISDVLRENVLDKDSSLRRRMDNVNFYFGVTQSDIDQYVENAYAKKNELGYKKYSIASEKLINDVKNEINVKGYVHVLRDNDIRHIRNSHGEQTNEKYPVTKEDIKSIPWLIETYDKVFVVKRNKGRTGIVYVKAADNGLVYYLEQATTVYGNEPLLVNKQMIKTGIGDIPDLKGLKDAITKKQSETEFLNDLKKAQQVYVQNVCQSHSENNISTPIKNVNVKTNQTLRSITPQLIVRWNTEAEAAKRTYGDFDLGTELQNPQFRKLLQSGVSVSDAYLISHQEEVFMNAARMAVRLAEEKVNRRVEENRRRPRENGLSPVAPFVTKPNVSKMTRADRQAIARRVAKGERIVF